MSTTMNMSPKNLMILAALGIGAYFLTTRRAVAGTATGQVPLPWSQSPTRAITANGQPGHRLRPVRPGLPRPTGRPRPRLPLPPQAGEAARLHRQPRHPGPQARIRGRSQGIRPPELPQHTCVLMATWSRM